MNIIAVRMILIGTGQIKLREVIFIVEIPPVTQIMKEEA